MKAPPYLKFFIRPTDSDDLEKYVSSRSMMNEEDFLRYRDIMGLPSPFKYANYQEYLNDFTPLTDEDVAEYKNTLIIDKIAMTAEGENLDQDDKIIARGFKELYKYWNDKGLWLC